MKKLFYILACILVYACTPVMEESELTADQRCEMHILTRSSVDINYPLALYAFDIATGKMASSAFLSSDADDAVLYLSKGNYQLVALSGVSTVEKNPTLDDIIALSSDMDIPLQMGSATVYAIRNTTVSIMLYNQVSAVDILLCDLPADVTDVDVTLSLLYDGVSYKGTFSGTSAVTKSLKKGQEGWYADRFYVLPTCNDQLTLSITIVSDEGTSSYSYTHKKPLLANTPYSLVGTLSSGFSINSSIEAIGWNPAEEINFFFGDTGNSDFDAEDSLEDFVVSEIPQPGELWNNHFVAATEELTDTSAVLLLLSTTEWMDIPSAFNADDPDMAESVVRDYSEGELSGWSIPTRDDAKLMRVSIGNEHIATTNALLSANAIPVLQVGEDFDGNTIRYLCDDATYSYVWDGSTISKCGTKRTYYLRAVKRVKVVEVLVE